MYTKYTEMHASVSHYPLQFFSHFKKDKDNRTVRVFVNLYSKLSDWCIYWENLNSVLECKYIQITTDITNLEGQYYEIEAYYISVPTARQHSSDLCVTCYSAVFWSWY